MRQGDGVFSPTEEYGMNPYININRIEFVITDACSGRCKHCSNGERLDRGDSVNADAAVATIKRLAERYAVQSLMTFGGEPLLFADTVCKIHATARDCGIPKRQLITNGFFAKDRQKIDETVKALCRAGVNEVLLSVDAFHQEIIPLEPVIQFAEALLRHNAPSLRVHPAWVVDEENENPYNTETRRLLKIFFDMGIRASDGNNIFPSGNALKHLSEYFAPPEKIDLSAPCGSAPYTSRLDEIDCINISPNGNIEECSITIGNIYNDDVLDVIDRYDPYGNPAWSAVLNGGVMGLQRYAQTQGMTVDTSDCRSACGVCRKIMTAMKEREKSNAIKLIVTDLDGTLLREDKTISGRTKSALRKCRDAGMRVACATGRGIAERVIPDEMIDASITFNGAVAKVGDAVAYNRLVPCLSARPLLVACAGCGLKTASQFNGIHYSNYIVSDVWSFITTFKIVDFAKHDMDAEKLYMLVHDSDDVAFIQEHLPEELYMTLSRDDMVMVMHKEATKSNALAALAEYWGINPSEIVAFGDDLNDVDMLSYAGVGVAMGNALEEVKAVADYVCDTNENDGVAQWLEENVL